MKLVQKLVLAVWLAVLPVLAVHGYLSVKRELALFRADMVRDLRLLGDVLAGSVVREWQSRGPDEALGLLTSANQSEHRIEARWIAADRLQDRGPSIGSPKSNQLVPEDMEHNGTRTDGSRLYVRVPVEVAGVDRGLIELSESLAPMHAYVRATVVRMGLLTIGMIVVSLVAAIGLGDRLIGRRLARVVEHARRVGGGDLSSRLEVSGRDEVAILASQMNSMCMDLAEAHSKEEHANEERHVALDRLRHSERLVSVGRLTSSLAHGLGTPLGVVRGWAKLIAARELSASETADAAEIISREVEEMTETVRQLLRFTRRDQRPKSQIDLLELALQTRGLLQPLARARRITLEVVASTLPALIQGRRGEIEQVLMNLIVNGIEAMPNGGTITIEIRLADAGRSDQPSSEDRRYLSLDVRDDGAGISERDLPHIFEPFFTTKTHNGGTGIGLWLVEGIARDHGGWINVESELGAGTRFSVYFPADVKRNREAEIRENDE